MSEIDQFRLLAKASAAGFQALTESAATFQGNLDLRLLEIFWAQGESCEWESGSAYVARTRTRRAEDTLTVLKEAVVAFEGATADYTNALASSSALARKSRAARNAAWWYGDFLRLFKGSDIKRIFLEREAEHGAAALRISRSAAAQYRTSVAALSVELRDKLVRLGYDITERGYEPDLPERGDPAWR